jgi:hypothetical protein
MPESAERESKTANVDDFDPDFSSNGGLKRSDFRTPRPQGVKAAKRKKLRGKSMSGDASDDENTAMEGTMRETASAMRAAKEQRIKKQAGYVESKKMKLKIRAMREPRKCQKRAVSFLKDVFDDKSPEELVLAKRKI